ncbi:MAG TPA: hypothetical protein VIE64_10150 [Solirubrobacterales bacterium]
MPLHAAIAVDNGTVLVLVTLIVLPIAAIAFARSGAAWKELGKGTFAIDQEVQPRQHAQPTQQAGRAVLEAEARQMLEAKSYRQRQRGEAPIDVETTMAHLLESAASTPTHDAELRAEVRRLVIARNERRIRQGQAPLDVEAETERQLARFA